VKPLDLSLYSDLAAVKIFSEGLKKGSLVYSLCRKCSQKHLPPRLYCNICGSTSLDTVEFKPSKGKVVASTMVNYPPSRYKGEEPYGLVVVEFENGLRIMGRIKIGAQRGPELVGSEAKLVLDTEKPDFWFTSS
jgi:uncharacterized OB-fold protein